MRKLPQSATVLLVLLCSPALVLVAVYYLPEHWLIEKFESALFSQFGVEASINTIELDLLRLNPQVKGSDVSLLLPESATQVSGINFTASYHPISLLAGGTHPQSLTLDADKGVITIPTNQDGIVLTHQYSLNAGLRKPRNTIELTLDNLKLDGSDVTGTLTIDTSTSPPTLTGDFKSGLTNLDSLEKIRAAIIRSTRRPPGTGEAGNRYFSPRPLNLEPLIRHISGTVRYNIQTARYRNLTMNAVAMTLSANGETSLLSIDSDEFIDGKLQLLAALSLVSGQPRLQLETELTQLSIGELFSVLGDENTAAGKISGKGKYWFTGRSSASLAASANGGMFLLIDQGELDSMFIELAGLDVTESVSLLLKKSIKSASVNCGYIDIKTRNGISTLADFVMDTEDTVFTGGGTVNFNSQKINITIKPLPRDAGFLAAPTAIRIGGTLLQPTIRPAKTLLTRLATAAALATFASPAAAVLPFIEIGNDASGEGCASYVKTVE